MATSSQPILTHLEPVTRALSTMRTTPVKGTYAAKVAKPSAGRRGQYDDWNQQAPPCEDLVKGDTMHAIPPAPNTVAVA